MRLALLLLAVLFAAMVAAIGLHQDNGYVMLAWSDVTVEMSLAMLVLLTALLYTLVWLFVRLLVAIWRMPARMRELRRRLRLRKARVSLTKGLIEISEGRWRDGEKTLVRHARHSDTPLPHYLVAARAAQIQGAHERRDNHLRLAYETTPAATTAVLLTQAELQLAHGQYERALATLSRLRELVPKHAFALRLLARLHESRGEWDALYGLFPELKRVDAFEDADLDALMTRVYAEKLATAGPDDADALWSELPRRLRSSPGLVIAYVGALRRSGRDDDAESMLRSVLRQQWNEDLVLLYGLLATSNTGKQIARAESWLRERGDTAVLLLTCGRLCMRGGLWGKARSYLESSIASAPRADAWQELAKLMEHTGDAVRAAECYRKGLALAQGGKEGVGKLPPVRTPVQMRTPARAMQEPED